MVFKTKDMRANIKALCVTTWGAVLELKGLWKYAGKLLVDVADPDAIDSGQYISIDDIVLIARKKQ